VPLGQTDGQRTLAALTPLCQQIAQDAQTSTLDDLHSTAFLSDIMAMRHETLQPRIFRS
jgi:urease accessory protein